MNDNPQFPYARCSIAALARLLNAACGASAIHRGIREEVCRRLALAAKTKPGEQPLLFTGAEWSRTIQRGNNVMTSVYGHRTRSGRLPHLLEAEGVASLRVPRLL
jgi:hypothetical protein